MQNNKEEVFENIGIYENGQFFLGANELRIGSEVEICTDIKFRGNELDLVWSRAFVCGLEDHRKSNAPRRHTGTKPNALVILAIGDGSSSVTKEVLTITDPSVRPRIRWPKNQILTRSFGKKDLSERVEDDIEGDTKERKVFGKGRLG